MHTSLNRSEQSDQPLSVLFVDDERRILDGLRRMFRANRSKWDMRFALSGAEAIEELTKRPADVVVSDMRMPGMCGSVLLNRIRVEWPETIRFILSGQTDQAELLEDIGCIHQFIQKPCDPELLEHAIARTRSLASALESSKLRRVVSGVQSLPIVSQVYTDLVEELNSDSSNADSIARIIEKDIGLSTKILQLVNSAFFGMPRKTVSVKDATVLIGISNLQQIVTTAQIFDTLGQDKDTHGFVSQIWSRSSDIGATARQLAQDSGLDKEHCDTAYLSGVLSHIGRAILARTMPQEFTALVETAKDSRSSIRALEIEQFGIPQESLGAYALGIWGFSDSIVDSVAHQEVPAMSRVVDQRHPIVWLHLARSMNCSGLTTETAALDREWAESLGIEDLEAKTQRSAA